MEDKISIYVKRKAGEQIPALCQEYDVSKSAVKYLIRLIDIHGYDKLRKGTNRTYTKDFKEKAIGRVLKGKETTLSISLDLGLPSTGVLRSWVSKYKENCYNVVEKKKGRKPMNKSKEKINAEKPELEQLKHENLCLKAELEYLKKLQAAVEFKEKQQQKKK